MGGVVILVDSYDVESANPHEHEAAKQVALGDPAARAELATVPLAIQRTKEALALAELRGTNVDSVEIVGQSLGGTEAEAIAANLLATTPIIIDRVSTLNAPIYISISLTQTEILFWMRTGTQFLSLIRLL